MPVFVTMSHIFLKCVKKKWIFPREISFLVFIIRAEIDLNIYAKKEILIYALFLEKAKTLSSLNCKNVTI